MFVFERRPQLVIATGILAAALTLALGYSGCSRSADNAGDTQGSGAVPGKIPSKDSSEGQALLDQAEVSCPDPSDCPESVGMVVALHDTVVTQCTGFLVARDVVMTSSHCVPSDLARGDAPCGDRLKILFPSTGNLASSRTSCAKVLVASDLNVPDRYVAPDFALLKLDRPILRERMMINTDGLPANSDVIVPHMNPISPIYPQGEIRTMRCKVVQDTLALPQFQSESSPVATVGDYAQFGDCKVVYGNHGSPLLDRNGEVRGILHAAFDAKEKLKIQLGFEGPLPEKQSDLAFATNAACLSFPSTVPAVPGSRPLPHACAADLSIGATQYQVKHYVTSRDVQLAESYVESLFNAWESAHSDRVAWNLNGQADASQISKSPVPLCFNQPSKWINQYQKPWYELGGYHHKAEIRLDLPQWQELFDVNSYLQVIHKQKDVAPVPGVLMFSPKDLHDKGRSLVTLRLLDGSSRDGKQVFSSVLGACN